MSNKEAQATTFAIELAYYPLGEAELGTPEWVARWHRPDGVKRTCATHGQNPPQQVLDALGRDVEEYMRSLRRED
ncbi:hypothetical protein [Acrocarpospora sp. B8E8]|uniref:hypothetical protein n=1 Tax=Acrocarpospora sp. B8E8 TaxID=3153572 RepID=UPI00325D43EC